MIASFILFDMIFIYEK